MDNDKNLADQVDALTKNVARLTVLIVQMRELFNVYNNKLEKIAYLIEEAEQYEFEADEHDLN